MYEIKYEFGIIVIIFSILNLFLFFFIKKKLRKNSRTIGFFNGLRKILLFFMSAFFLCIFLIFILLGILMIENVVEKKIGYFEFQRYSEIKDKNIFEGITGIPAEAKFYKGNNQLSSEKQPFQWGELSLLSLSIGERVMLMTNDFPENSPLLVKIKNRICLKIFPIEFRKKSKSQHRDAMHYEDFDLLTCTVPKITISVGGEDFELDDFVLNFDVDYSNEEDYLKLPLKTQTGRITSGFVFGLDGNDKKYDLPFLYMDEHFDVVAMHTNISESAKEQSIVLIGNCKYSPEVNIDLINLDNGMAQVHFRYDKQYIELLPIPEECRVQNLSYSLSRVT